MNMVPYGMLFLLVIFQSPVLEATLIEDLQLLFANKHCIEASLVSLSLNEDQGTEMSEKFSQAHKAMLNSSSKRLETSVTSKVNELAQYNQIEFVYKLVSEEGPPHAKTFTVVLILGDENYKASASNLKKAKQSAASLALQHTLYEKPPEKIKEDLEKSQSPTVVLNNVAMKLGLGVSYYLLNGREEKTIDSYGASEKAYGGASYYQKLNSTSDPFRVPVEEPHLSGPFTVKVTVGEFVFKGIGHTVQAARHDAAFKAVKNMQERALFIDDVCSKEDSVEECKKRKETLKSPITRVYEAAGKHNLPVEFNIISETGKSHKKVFVTQCILGDFITEGEGTSKKESKKASAEKMLKNISYLPEKYSENEIHRGLSNKKTKRKKKKIVKSNVNTLISDLSYVVSSIWSESGKTTSNSDESPQGKNNKKSSLKDRILEVGNQLNIPVDFTDLQEHGNVFFSLMTLGVNPPHLCFGKATTREKSHEAAALYGIKFLHNSGIFEKTELFQYDSLISDIRLEEFKDETEYEYFTDLKEEL